MKQSHKIHRYIILVVILIALVLKAFSYYYPKQQIIIGENILNVLVADTPVRQFKGLSNKKDLGQYDGMLFTFLSSDHYTIVMRDMNFPIDIVWINNNKIIDLTYNAQVEKNRAESQLTQYSASSTVNMILEVPAGFINKKGLKIGDNVLIMTDEMFKYSLTD